VKQACIRCVVRLVLCFRFVHSESQILPPAADPQVSPKRGRITCKLPTPLLLEQPAHGDAARRRQGRLRAVDSWLGAQQPVLEQPRGCPALPLHASHPALPLHLLCPAPSSQPRLDLARHPGTRAPQLAGLSVSGQLPCPQME